VKKRFPNDAETRRQGDAATGFNFYNGIRVAVSPRLRVSSLSKQPLANGMDELNEEALKLAAADFLYLMDRGYPRAASLQLVGNRYNFDALQREILHRGVFAREEARKRRMRLIEADQLVSRRLLVDGHNVIITTESCFSDRPLIAANDGVSLPLHTRR